VPERPRVAIKTLGCKLNQYESEQIREDFEALGFESVDFSDEAEVYVINSCTVTHRTDRDARRLSRQARRRSPGSMIIVTGCYAELQPEVLEDLGVVDLVAPNDRKGELARAAAEWLGQQGIACEQVDQPEDAHRLVRRFPENTRAFVKVQTGCDANCAYCTIRHARGPSRSVPPEIAIEQAKMLAENGHPEIVLVGIHLGVYGNDLEEPGLNLDELVRRMCAVDTIRRLRLSSIEPMEISDALIEMVAEGGRALRPAPDAPCSGKLCRHLHIPMQSGCDATLQRMRRPYTSREYADLVRRIAAREGRICIGSDVLAGFPGETEEEFDETIALVESLPLAYLHAFTYSERPGTAAAEMAGQVDPEIRKQRTNALRALSRKKSECFAAAHFGQELEVVVETRADRAGWLNGIADNYLRVRLEGPESLCGELVAVQVIGREGTDVIGRLI